MVTSLKGRDDGSSQDHGTVARVVRAALKTRDQFLEAAEAQRFDDEVFHAMLQAAYGWQMFAEALVGEHGAAELRK